MMREHRVLSLVVAFFLLATACGPSGADDSNVARGRKLQLAALPVASEAAAYDAAARAAFDLGPGLTLLLHPLRLPRTAGYAGGDSVPAALVRALQARGVVAGVCDPIRETALDTPRCHTTVPGYIVRASDVFRVSTDTIELYFSAEQFGPASGQRPPVLRFERIYQLVGRASSWRVAREARVR